MSLTDLFVALIAAIVALTTTVNLRLIVVLALGVVILARLARGERV